MVKELVIEGMTDKPFNKKEFIGIAQQLLIQSLNNLCQFGHAKK